MKRIYLATLIFCSAIYTDAQPIFQWAKGITATTTSEGKSMAVDAAGNVITTGIMRGTSDFDPGAGIFNLTTAGVEDIFISKLDANGNFLWAKRIGGQATDQGESVTTDAAGNVYVTGWFTGYAPDLGNVDFDPGPGVFYLTDVGGIEAYVLKLDADGNFVWAKSIEGITSNTHQYGKGIGFDAADNLFITGAFYSTVDFDPGPGVFTLTAQTGIGTDIFLTKWDASGNFIWAKQLGGAEGDYPNKLFIDAGGNALITGYFSATADFDPGAGVFNVTSAGGTDIFACKINNNGDFVWAKNWGGVSNDDGYGITADLLGNVFLATSFVGTFDADPGVGVSNVTSAGSFDVFLCKLNAAGNFQWAKRWGAGSSDQVFDIKTDAAGNVYAAGNFASFVDFDPGPAQFILNALGPSRLFYSKFDAAGNFIWAVKLEGGGATLYSLQVNAANEIFSTGYFSQTIDFDPGAGVFNLTSLTTDIFINKLSQSGTLPLTLVQFSGTATANGNLLNWKTAQEINTKHFEVELSSNGQQFNNITILPAAGNSSQLLHYNYLHSQPVSGDNFYRLKMVDIDGRFTYSPIIVINSAVMLSSAKIFPNPVTDNLQLYIHSEKRETIVCNLYSVDGKFITSKKAELIKGANLLRWNIHHLMPGNYFLSTTGNKFGTIKIIKK